MIIIALSLTAALGSSAASADPAEVTIRAYVMNGLLGELVTNAMNEIGAELRARGDIVTVGSWVQVGEFVADACEHRGDHIVIVGHSMGALMAARMVNDLRACGAHSVRAVMIDPPTDSSIPAGSNAVNFVGQLGGKIAGAKNIPIPGVGHVEIVNDRGMQRRIVQAAQ
jgi:pimeloyl-ACP methyl ester carboxylesterase